MARTSCFFFLFSCRQRSLHTSRKFALDPINSLSGASACVSLKARTRKLLCPVSQPRFI